MSSTKEYTPTPNSYTLASLQWAVPSEMSLTIKCLGANGDAEWFLPPQPSFNKRINLLLQNNGGSVISGKSVSPVGNDMGIITFRRLLKNKQLFVSYILGRN